MSDKCTLGAIVDATLYTAFTAYCERNGVKMSEVLRDFATYCVLSQMPEYTLPKHSGGLVQNKQIIDYFKKTKK